MKSLTEYLRQRLSTSGNISQIARTTGIPQQVLQRFASGKQANLRLDTAEKLMQQFGVQWSDSIPFEVAPTLTSTSDTLGSSI